jgi:hypothetical protein
MNKFVLELETLVIVVGTMHIVKGWQPFVGGKR